MHLRSIPHVNLIGADSADEHLGIITFTVDGVHPHDIAAIFDADHVAIRAGHHCAQPLHQFLGVQSTVRMSLALYNDEQDVDKFVNTLKSVRRRMGLER